MNINNNVFCCGCRACEQICPKQAISVRYDHEGFLKAEIDEGLCVECGMCCKVCPALEQKCLTAAPVKVYAAINKDDVAIRRSASGGVFSALAEYVLRMNGSVYGCKLDNDLSPIQCRVDRMEDLDSIRRSKYVQSDTKSTFTQVKEDLRSGLTVLYVGTPCQISALRAFLGKDYSALFCVDLVCHGVPSALMFRESVDNWSKQKGSLVSSYEFRLKALDYLNDFHFFIRLENGKTIYRPYYYDPYYEAFYNMKDYNEMCYHCPYACEKRAGDITIGDYFWAGKYHPELSDRRRSISCVMVNSQNGERLLEAVCASLDIFESKLEWVMERNKNLCRPTPRPSERDSVYSDIKRLGYRRWSYKYYSSDAFLQHVPILSYWVKIKRKILEVIK